MDEAMISLWNQRVNHDDNAYILGDFCYRNEKSAEWYLSQLKGHNIWFLATMIPGCWIMRLQWDIVTPSIG